MTAPANPREFYMGIRKRNKTSRSGPCGEKSILIRSGYLEEEIFLFRAVVPGEQSEPGECGLCTHDKACNFKDCPNDKILAGVHNEIVEAKNTEIARLTEENAKLKEQLRHKKHPTFTKTIAEFHAEHVVLRSRLDLMTKNNSHLTALLKEAEKAIECSIAILQTYMARVEPGITAIPHFSKLLTKLRSAEIHDPGEEK